MAAFRLTPTEMTAEDGRRPSKVSNCPKSSSIARSVSGSEAESADARCAREPEDGEEDAEADVRGSIAGTTVRDVALGAEEGELTVRLAPKRNHLD